MRPFCVVLVTTILAVSAVSAASAATLSDAKVGFSADRTLVINGKAYQGKMWTMPGRERHEQNLNGIPAAFILSADKPIAEAVLPQLHTVVQFVVPPEFHLLGDPKMTKHPAGHETVNGIATTKYDVDETVPEGHGTGSLWLSAEGIPMKMAGTFTASNGKVATLRWELNHVKTGPQPDSLFQSPAGFSKLSAEAVLPLLNLRLKGAH
jgi:hypothetical protein